MQTSWKPLPAADDPAEAEAGAALCSRWRAVLQHGLNPVGGDPLDRGWAEWDAAEALRRVGLLEPGGPDA